MFAAGYAGCKKCSSSIIGARFPLLSAARIRGCARHVLRAWHRPHNTATLETCFLSVFDYPSTVSRIEQHCRRKCHVHSGFHPEIPGGWRSGQGPDSGAFRQSASGTKPRQNTAIYCHFFAGYRGHATGGQRIRVRTEDGRETVGPSINGGGRVRSEMRSMSTSMSTSRIKKTTRRVAECRPKAVPNLNLNLAPNPLPDRNLTLDLNLALAFCETNPFAAQPAIASSY